MFAFKSPSDVGLYFCQILQKRRDGTDRILTSRSTLLSMEQFAPNILLQPEDCIFHINDQIELKCCAKAYPSPAYQWSKNNVKLPGEVHSTLLVYYNHYNVADHFKRFMIYLDFQCIHRSFWLLRLPHL